LVIHDLLLFFRALGGGIAGDNDIKRVGFLTSNDIATERMQFSTTLCI
jgi:hypothetical protein